jgi:Ca-activated chloride channel homolog
MRAAVFETIDGDALILERVSAKGRVVGRMLDMTVEQHFRNPDPFNIEVVYTFPLPWHAVLLGLEVELNGETLTGQVKVKSQARSDYEEALSEGNTGILVSVNADRSYTLELGNLLARECCVVRLHYVQILQPEQGSLRLTLPTTIAPRYGDPIRDGQYEPHAVPEVSATVEYPFHIALAIQGELVQAQIGSPSHPVAIRTIPVAGSREGFFTEVSLGAQAWLDRDFVLVFDQLAHDSQGLTAWDRFDNALGVLMASFTPRLPTRQTLPVAMKILVDCSGSMNGDSITAARRALLSILDGLNAQDRFTLSRFGDSVEHRGKAMWKGSPAALAAARRWTSALEADMGGTEMGRAIESTLKLPGAERSDVLLITDGEIFAIDEVVESACSSGHRFFVVGIGASAAEGNLRRLATETGGSCEFVAPGELVEPAIVRLYHRMRTPVVTHPRIEWPQGCSVHAVSDLPKSIFDGDDVTVYGRLHAPNSEALLGKVRLLGRVDGVEGEICLAELSATFIADEANTLARLAANHRYWQLRHGSETVPAVLTKQLPALAEKYQLVTDDTSLVLVKERVAGEQALDMPQIRPVKGMLAAGWGGHGSVQRSDVQFSRRMDPNVQMSVSFEVTRERIRQIESKAVRKLKHPARSDKLRAFLDSMDADIPPLDTVRSEEAQDAKLPKKPADKPEFWNSGLAKESTGTRWSAYAGLTPAGFVEWLRLNPDNVLESYAALREAGLPQAVVDWLELVVGAGQTESDVVRAFVQVMNRHGFTLKQSWAATLSKLESASSTSSGPLHDRIGKAMSTLTATSWPVMVEDFTDVDQ